MKAYVFDGVDPPVLVEKAKPELLEPTDVIVKVLCTTICGTDLHILRGNVLTFKPGITLGHEGFGVVDQCGDDVDTFEPGDEVIISCITACGKCPMCQRSQYGQCLNGGWVLGNVIDGCQAEYVRIPHARHSLHHAPEDIDRRSLTMLSDIFPTGLEVGVQSAHVKPGDSIAVVGAGPVGLAAIMTSQLYSPGILYATDNIEHRLETAKTFGATDVFDNSKDEAVDEILECTDGLGVDVVIEAIGVPAGWDMSQHLVRPGGNIAVLGVHGMPATINLEEMWRRNFTMTAGLVHTNTIPMLIQQIRAGRLHPELLYSHEFGLCDIPEAYDTFMNAGKTNALKMILHNE